MKVRTFIRKSDGATTKTADKKRIKSLLVCGWVEITEAQTTN